MRQLLLALLLCASATAATLKHPATWPACSDALVRVVATPELADSSISLTVVMPPGVDAIQQGNTLVFAAGAPKTVAVYCSEVAIADGKIDQRATVGWVEIVSDGTTPPVDDDPDTPPSTGDFAKMAYDAAQRVPTEHMGLASRLADNFAWAASQVTSDDSERAIRAMLSTRNRQTLDPSSGARAAWVPWFNAMSKAWLVSGKDAKSVWEQIAKGLRRVKPASRRAVPLSKLPAVSPGIVTTTPYCPPGTI